MSSKHVRCRKGRSIALNLLRRRCEPIALLPVSLVWNSGHGLPTLGFLSGTPNVIFGEHLCNGSSRARDLAEMGRAAACSVPSSGSSVRGYIKYDNVHGHLPCALT
ncbi:hypothetical protein BV25DRAFT_705220 [Artomyces pyxidatus]|uniref:Uncharacterized protein n=1 Tax=Artomyces pyxidatus TaxID=48021 RepID=A0ACB8SYY4_9AGAM|nr:hypothetical protein BV25DRAFT_705220 [Artomyces pyxidatus]